MSDTAPVADVDLFDAAVLAEPWSVHGALREQAPAVWLPRHEIWVSGRDSVVRAVLVDPDRFSSARGVGLYDVEAGAPRKPSAILKLDPPEHTASRRVMNRLLSPRALDEMRSGFERRARTVVDAAIARGDVDAIADIAFPFPFTVLPDVVGLRTDGREHLATYSLMYFDTRAPDTERAAVSLMAAREAGSIDWVLEQCRREHLAPGKFGDRLYQAADAGEIDVETAEGLVRSFLGAGIDTTVLVLGTLLQQLASDPHQWQSLRDDPSLVRPAFDEALRWAPAAALVGRTTKREVDLEGITVGADQKIVCLMAAANRDPRRWERPDVFDIRRNTAGQLGFGIGPHFCVGHALARLEAECLLTELVGRVASIEPNGEPEALVNNWLLGPSRVPVRLHPA